MSSSALAKVRTAVPLAIVLVSLAVAGCGGGGEGSTDADAAQPHQGGTLRISQGEEVMTLDPLEALDGLSLNLVSQINESLFRVGANGKNEPWLASGAKVSADQRVWTLQLRDGVEFSDGQPMTSADVLFSFERARKSPIWGGLLEGIESLRAPSPATVVISNSKPAPELAAILSQWSFAIVPEDFGGVSEKEFAEHPVGTGPFMLGRWKHGEALTLERNPRYWQEGRPFLDKVVFQTVPDGNSRVSQLRGGQLDVVANPPWPQVESIESVPGLEVGKYPLGFSQAIVLNARRPLFQNEKVREAVYLAVDREGLVSAALAGNGRPAGSWIPPVVPYHDAGIAAPAQDVEKAKQLVAAAVKEGVDPSFTMLNNPASSFWGTAVQVVQQNLAAIGLEMKIQQVEIASLSEALIEGDFDVASVEAYDAIPSPSELFGLYNAYEGIYSGADVAATTKLASEAQSEADPAKREDLWHRAQQIIEDEKFVVTVAYMPYAWALRDSVGGFTISTTGIPWLADTGFTD